VSKPSAVPKKKVDSSDSDDSSSDEDDVNFPILSSLNSVFGSCSSSQ